MRGGRVHPSIAHHPFLGEARTAPRYRFYVYEDRFPALWPVADGGVSVPGELIELPLEAVRDEFLPGSPRSWSSGWSSWPTARPAWRWSCARRPRPRHRAGRHLRLRRLARLNLATARPR